MSKIHTITVMEDAEELIGKRVRVAGLSNLDAHYNKAYTHKMLSKTFIYLGNADVKTDYGERIVFGYGLQIEEVEG